MTTFLKQPLGPWTPPQNPTCQWHVNYIPQQQAIMTHYPDQPCQIFYPTHKTRSHQYFSQGQNLNLIPSISYPVTIDKQKVGFRIARPIPTYKLCPLSPPLTPSPDLQQNIRSRLPNYTPELWSVIQCIEGKPPTTLAEHISHVQEPIIIVSDASLNAQKRSAFSWMISTQNSELWIGSGTCPGTQRDAHSGRSEGYGLLAAMTFWRSISKPQTPRCPPPQSQSKDSATMQA